MGLAEHMRSSRVTRRLAVIQLQPGANLQTEVDNANPGDELVLADGTYTGSGTSENGDNMLYINKDITIRALNPGQVVLDGQNARRVIYIASGNVVLEGLDITRGSATYVRARQPPLLPIGAVRNGPSKLSGRFVQACSLAIDRFTQPVPWLLNGSPVQRADGRPFPDISKCERLRRGAESTLQMVQ